LRYSVWHRLSSKDKDPILGEPIPEVHNDDEDKGTVNTRTLNLRMLQEALETLAQQHIKEALQTAEEEEAREQEDDESQDEQDQTNINIQNSPIRTSPTHTFGKERTTQRTMTTTTQTTTQTTPPPTNPPMPTTTKAQLISTFDQMFKQLQGGGGGGGGGGEGRPGGPLPAPPLQPNALVPVPAAVDMRVMGNKPKNFYGDRAKADTFIEDAKAYLCLNEDMAGYNSPKNKIAFTLMCIKGDEVSGWTRAMGEMLDTLSRDQNVPLLWDFFLQEFNVQYLDTAREDRARAEITKLKLKDNDIDTYIAKFEELARQAGYTLGSPESIQLFEEGLSYPILADVMRAPIVSGYYAIKERATHSAMAQRKLAAK
jgi:hypothetical protein